MGINPYQERLLIEAIQRGQIPPQLMQMIQEQSQYSPEGQPESTTEAGEEGWEAPEPGSFADKATGIATHATNALMGGFGPFGVIGQHALASQPEAQRYGVKPPGPVQTAMGFFSPVNPFSFSMLLGLPMAIYSAIAQDPYSEGVSYESMGQFDPASYGFDTSLSDGYEAGLGGGYGIGIGDFGYGFDATGFGLDGYDDGGWDGGYGDGGFGDSDSGGMSDSADAGAGGGMGGGADAGADGW